MAWIDIIEEGEAEGDLSELYRRMVDPESGSVDNVLKIHSLHPTGLKAHWDLYVAAMSGTPGLRKVDRELIALHVSTLNACRY